MRAWRRALISLHSSRASIITRGFSLDNVAGRHANPASSLALFRVEPPRFFAWTRSSIKLPKLTVPPRSSCNSWKRMERSTSAELVDRSLRKSQQKKARISPLRREVSRESMADDLGAKSVPIELQNWHIHQYGFSGTGYDRIVSIRELTGPQMSYVCLSAIGTNFHHPSTSCTGLCQTTTCKYQVGEASTYCPVFQHSSIRQATSLSLPVPSLGRRQAYARVKMSE